MHLSASVNWLKISRWGWRLSLENVVLKNLWLTKSFYVVHSFFLPWECIISIFTRPLIRTHMYEFNNHAILKVWRLKLRDMEVPHATKSNNHYQWWFFLMIYDQALAFDSFQIPVSASFSKGLVILAPPEPCNITRPSRQQRSKWTSIMTLWCNWHWRILQLFRQGKVC